MAAHALANRPAAIARPIPDLIPPVARPIPDLIPPIASAVTDPITTIGQLVAHRVTMPGGPRLRIIGRVGDGITHLFPRVARRVAEILPRVARGLAELLAGVAGGIAEIVPRLAGALAEFFASVAHGIADRVLVAAGGTDLLARIARRVAEVLPRVARGLAELLAGVAGGVAEIVPRLAGALAELLTGVLEGIAEIAAQTIPRRRRCGFGRDRCGRGLRAAVLGEGNRRPGQKEGNGGQAFDHAHRVDSFFRRLSRRDGGLGVSPSRKDNAATRGILPRPRLGRGHAAALNAARTSAMMRERPFQWVRMMALRHGGMAGALVAALLFAFSAHASDSGDDLRRAAEAGDGAAQLALGTALLAGGSEADWADGIAWLEKAARQGAPVYMIIADSYAHGVGVAPEPARAAHWYRIGAETGDPLAQYEIGRRYLEGEGVTPDAVQAIFYLELAVTRLGDGKAREQANWALMRAKWGATPEERARVAALLRAWRPKTLSELLN